MIALLLLGYRNLTISEQRAIMAESEIYDLNVYKAFLECKDFAQMFMKPIDNKIGYYNFDLEPNETVCIVGSIVVGGSADYHVDAAIAKATKEGPKWETISKDNAMFVVPDIKAKVDISKMKISKILKELFNLVTVIAPPVSKIKCNNGKACTIQIHPIPPSYQVEIKNEIKFNLDISFRFKSIFSTKSTGAFNIKYKTGGSVSKTALTATVDLSQGLYLSSTEKNFTYTRDEKVDFLAGKDDYVGKFLGIPCHHDKEGPIGASKNNWFRPMFNVKDILKDLTFSLNVWEFVEDNLKKFINIDGSTVITWAPMAQSLSTKANITDNPEKVYFEELTYSVPANGGVYDKKDVGLADAPWYVRYQLVMILCAAVIIVGIIAAVVAIVLVKKYKKNDSETKGADAV
ncbi:hypothetical protein TVAG_108920 [Trichomonas vaginalis G3]|uniref:Uncharacterized protein n=1 Tax=Trichomonas vaginalis (strain ATCC PRA-98 / G3) TaxID=412133 RepID=A2F033_TRIV3|nr:glycoprotein 38 family [Trichomonas vaginalis G3]EAY01735.1 hypothetical protein TVAG_108920 [Trichomonas vaginalis G3]KAI5532799.1 glycoprotein 38 family [Trichomonas vaginalis G3]|eukprot:XP_001314293.1 hypothetical protein [Trichomonas vaginalis G3]